MLSSLFSANRRLRKAEIPALAQVTPSPWRQAWQALRRNRLAMLCLLLLAMVGWKSLYAFIMLAVLWLFLPKRRLTEGYSRPE
ncbi:hypothetical protein ACS0TW_06080 [Klebsiella michiganensis]